jgi:hypothetical protein
LAAGASRCIDEVAHPPRGQGLDVPAGQAVPAKAPCQRRRIAMRYDRCAHTFFSAITLAASGSVNKP